jgi:hypothetical protein
MKTISVQTCCVYLERNSKMKIKLTVPFGVNIEGQTFTFRKDENGKYVQVVTTPSEVAA